MVKRNLKMIISKASTVLLKLFVHYFQVLTVCFDVKRIQRLIHDIKIFEQIIPTNNLYYCILKNVFKLKNQFVRLFYVADFLNFSLNKSYPCVDN